MVACHAARPLNSWHAREKPLNEARQSKSSATSTWHEQHGRYPQAGNVADFRRNLMQVRQRIADACLRVGRDPQEVRLLPVSKTFSEPQLRLAYEAGCRQLGEKQGAGGLSKMGQPVRSDGAALVGDRPSANQQGQAGSHVSPVNFRHWTA